METTLTAVRVDLGAVGGHLRPSEALVATVRNAVAEKRNDLIIDCWAGYTGDDITLLWTHEQGPDSAAIRAFLWQAFEKGVLVAERQGLCGVGQDISEVGMTLAARMFSPPPARWRCPSRWAPMWAGSCAAATMVS